MFVFFGSPKTSVLNQYTIHKQYIQVDITFSYIFHLGLQEHAFLQMNQIHIFLAPVSELVQRHAPGSKKSKNVLKCDVYLLVVSVYVLTYSPRLINNSHFARFAQGLRTDLV